MFPLSSSSSKSGSSNVDSHMAFKTVQTFVEDRKCLANFTRIAIYYLSLILYSIPLQAEVSRSNWISITHFILLPDPKSSQAAIQPKISSHSTDGPQIQPLQHRYELCFPRNDPIYSCHSGHRCVAEWRQRNFPVVFVRTEVLFISILWHVAEAIPGWSRK